MMYCITKWCKAITDDGKDHYTGRAETLKKAYFEKYGKQPEVFKFRLLDDDGIIYAYGLSTDNCTEHAFAPLDRYEGDYGCVSIEYKNPDTGAWEEL